VQPVAALGRSTHMAWAPAAVRAELSRRLLPLVLAGLLVQQVLPDPDRIVVLTAPKAPGEPTPGCPAARPTTRQL